MLGLDGVDRRKIYRELRTLGGKNARKIVMEMVARLPPHIRSHMLPLARFGMQFEISVEALAYVRDNMKGGGNLLVFGLGRDSSTWEAVNHRGRTAFIEDLDDWIERSTSESPHRQVYRVEYQTTVEDSMGYRLVADIPGLPVMANIEDGSWDIVVVDGPRGWAPELPGRASSVLAASRFVRSGGVILVDDYDRPLEKHICRLVFGRDADAVLCRERPVGVYRM